MFGFVIGPVLAQGVSVLANSGVASFSIVVLHSSGAAAS